MSTSALKDALKPPTVSKSASSKTPAYYSQQKNHFISEMATNPDETVRVAVAGSEYVPANTLKQMLGNEISLDVLRTILINPRTPWKAIIQFTDTDRALAFENDEEITEYLKSRVSGAGSDGDSTGE